MKLVVWKKNLGDQILWRFGPVLNIHFWVKTKHPNNGRYNTFKLITGVMAKFIITIYFAFSYTLMGEVNPTGIRQRAAAVQV